MSDRGAIWWVAALTALGVAIRAAGLGQSLFGDELSTYAIASQATGPADVVRLLHGDGIVELSPPLYFLLTSASAQIGDPTVTVRLPSLLAGAAMIPLVYLLGLRTVGRSAALVATGLAALSPFLIFYSVEARGYGFAAVLGLVSTLALLRAVEAGGTRWWAAYAIASCAAVYTHYTVVFVLGAQALWALWAHRRSWRPLLVANAAAALAFVPWIPNYLDDSASPFNVTGLLHPFGFETFFADLGDWTVSTPPITDLGRVPGDLGALLVGAGIVVAAGALAAAWWRSGERARPSKDLVLIVVLALATPIGMAAYSIAGPDIYLARVLIPSSPGLIVALAALLVAPRMPLRALAVGAVILGFSIGVVKTFDAANQRPDYRGAAAFVERQTEPEDPVYDFPVAGGPNGPLGTALAINLPGRTVEHPPDLDAAVAQQSAPRLAVVAPGFDVPGLEQPPQLAGYRLVDGERFAGAIELSAWVFERAP